MSYLYERRGAGRWTPPWLRYQNIERYRWASGFVAGRRVVEIGCGNGEGTRLLARAGATSVFGVDISAEAIAAARERYEGDGIRFEIADGRNLPVESESFDLVVALEAIEHFDDDSGFLTEVARVLVVSGMFVCSTPNRALTNPGTGRHHRPFNRHHEREYLAEELSGLLKEHFVQVDLLGQTFFSQRYRSLLEMVGRRLPGLARRLHQARKASGTPFESYRRHVADRVPPRRTPEVLLAVCSQPVR